MIRTLLTRTVVMRSSWRITTPTIFEKYLFLPPPSPPAFPLPWTTHPAVHLADLTTCSDAVPSVPRNRPFPWSRRHPVELPPRHPGTRTSRTRRWSPIGTRRARWCPGPLWYFSPMLSCPSVLFRSASRTVSATPIRQRRPGTGRDSTARCRWWPPRLGGRIWWTEECFDVTIVGCWDFPALFYRYSRSCRPEVKNNPLYF